MKNSGVEWIGDIPEGWEVLRGKVIFSLLKRNVLDSDEVITCFRDGTVTLRKNRREEGFTFSDKEIGYQGVEPGDLCVHGMDGFAGAIGVSDSRGKVSPIINVLETDYNKRFYMYFLRSMAYRNIFTALSTGIRVRSCDLRWNKLANLQYAVPPFETQKAIVSAIESKTTKIDSLISNEEKQIEKLKAYKQALITETVTKGLDKTVEMKDSGVEWIGEIPEGWEVRKIGKLFNFQGGGAFESSKFLSEGKNQVLRIGNIKNDNLILDNKEVYISDEYAEEFKNYELKENDILFTMTGTRKKKDYFYILVLEKKHFLEKKLFLNQRVGCFRCKENLFPKFYNYLLKETRIRDRIFIDETGTANQANIGIDLINQVLIQVPPLDVQEIIAKYLDSKCTQIDNLISLKESKIEKLNTYKKSLIYEYVTGKKQVSSCEFSKENSGKKEVK